MEESPNHHLRETTESIHRPVRDDIPDHLEHLPAMIACHDLIAKLAAFSGRNSDKEMAAIIRAAETVSAELSSAAEWAIAWGSSSAGGDLFISHFMPAFDGACTCCISNRESHYETLGRLFGRSGEPKERFMMKNIHDIINDSMASLRSELTMLRFELVRMVYLVKGRFHNKYHDIIPDALDNAEIESSALELHAASDVLDSCQKCLDIVCQTTSSNLLNQLFHSIWRSTSAIQTSHRTKTVECVWEADALEEKNPQEENSSLNPPVEEPSTAIEKGTVNAVSGVALVDLLPFDVWRKVLAYLTDDDAALYAVLLSSRQFRDLLSKSALDVVTDDEYWERALRRRGVDVETVCSRQLSWFGHYHEYVQSMACFRCFSRLCGSICIKEDCIRSATTTTETERKGVLPPKAYAGRILLEAGCVARGSSSRATADLPQDAVLGVKFCNWDMAQIAEEQPRFDNVIVSILGPPGTPYCGGYFQLWIHLLPQYPFLPLRAQLLTKIFSPFFTDHGDFYFPYNSVLGGGPSGTYFENWRIIYEISGVIDIVMKYLSLTAEGDDLLKGRCVVNHQVADLRRDDTELFERMARQHTQTHAMLRWQGKAKRDQSSKVL
ncbi:hypothetical protein BV898_08449 [Hypsibius exemplaris]|uniref:UBC core domain-containing protein n=1 Tax=Hypsibius exemplaris TaxID=2072580 RepID=A0A1W0WQN2_HYPEX|nr:hypothetical protein BV898_08449 [Hypsibius exemplaris]